MILFLNFVFILLHSFVNANPRVADVQNLLTSTFPFRIDTPRKIAALFTPYKLHEDITSQHICNKFANWAPTTKNWDKKLNPHNLTLCSRDYGGDGNCLYYVISGILRDNGYNIGKFDLERKDISPGIRVSLKAMKFDKNKYFRMEDIRLLASLCYVGTNPEIRDAQRFLDVEQLKNRLRLTMVNLDVSQDIKWNPEECLRKLEDPNQNLIDVAKTIYKSISSSSPVYNWGSGDDLYGLCELLNVDFLLFHKESETIQHFMSSHKKPVCTLNIYYYHMIHFQSAGIVANFMNSNQRKLSSLYHNFELDEKLYGLLPTSKSSL